MVGSQYAEYCRLVTLAHRLLDQLEVQEPLPSGLVTKFIKNYFILREKFS